MAGETGGLDKSTYTRIENRRCGYEYFSNPGLNVEKNFGRTKFMKTSVPHFCSATNRRTTKFFGGRGAALRRPDGAARRPYQGKRRILSCTPANCLFLILFILFILS